MKTLNMQLLFKFRDPSVYDVLTASQTSGKSFFCKKITIFKDKLAQIVAFIDAEETLGKLLKGSLTFVPT
jgi:hypothetical protein